MNKINRVFSETNAQLKLSLRTKKMQKLRRRDIASVALVFFQREALATPPAQHLKEVQTGIEDLVVLKHHFIESVDGEVSVGVGIFQCGHGGVKRVCLVAERWVFHGDDLEGVLETEQGFKSLTEHNTTEQEEFFISTSAMSSGDWPRVSKICL